MIRTLFSRKLILPALASLLALVCGPATAKTTVTVEGTTVVIHVPIEVVGPISGDITVTDPDTGVRLTVAAYYQKAETVWNEAFAGTKYADCLTFKLDLQLVFLPPKAPHQEGWHRVEYFTFFDNLPSGWFPTGPDDRVPTDDNPFPFQRDATGEWYSPDYGTVAHEIGHVLGLGDDYFTTCTAAGCKQGTGYKPAGQKFEGGADFEHGGTFTTSGIGTPDPTAVARVIQQIKAAGILPPCWKGALHLSGEGNVYSDEADIRLTFVADNDGKVGGTGSATVTPYPRIFVESDNCTYVHSVSPSSFNVAVEGLRKGDDFQLKIRPLTKATVQISVTGGPGAYCSPKPGPPVPASDPTGGTQFAALTFHVAAKDHAQRAGQENLYSTFKVDWRLEINVAD